MIRLRLFDLRDEVWFYATEAYQTRLLSHLWSWMRDGMAVTAYVAIWLHLIGVWL